MLGVLVGPDELLPVAVVLVVPVEVAAKMDDKLMETGLPAC